ncbi:MAG: SET domain-containing protein [Chitinophagaceae bacterium]|nr:MAG: SET domain-containing protein [Chitinophagaceae bacterium]
MAFFEKNLFVKKSRIPGSGKGLFTKVPIPKGSTIVEYKGKITTWAKANHGDGLNPYLFFVNKAHVIDAWHTPKHLARYANDGKGLVREKGLSNNAEYVTKNRKAYIEAKKDIPAGGEILVEYGADYWRVIRRNLREKAAAERKKMNS